MDPSAAAPPSPGQIIALLATLEDAIKTSRNIFSASLAAFAVLVFDWLLSLDSEITLIWKSKWNHTKILYLLCRYFHFIDFSLFVRHLAGGTLTESQCRTIYETGTILFALGVMVAELVMTIRTWAVWSKGKYVAIGFFGAFALVWSTIIVLVGLYLKASSHVASPIPDLLGCIIEGSETFMASIFFIIASVDTIMLILMITRGIYAFRSGGDSRLLKTVYGDGITFYIYLFLLAVVNLAVILNFSNLVVLLVMMQGAIHSTLACRVILHIRQHDRPAGDDVTNWEMGAQTGSKLRGTQKGNPGMSESRSVRVQWQSPPTHTEPEIQEL